MTIEKIREDAINKLLEPEHKEIARLKKEIAEKKKKNEELERKMYQEYVKETCFKTIAYLHDNGEFNDTTFKVLNALIMVLTYPN